MCPNRSRPVGRRRRAGLTLVELLISVTIMTILAGALAAISRAVQMGHQHSRSHTAATQQARVALDRIARMVNQATANEQFPGFAVFAEPVDGWSFPEYLVVWSPAAAPANPEGLPRWNEVVLFCPDAAAPNRLVEIRIPSDTRSVFPLSNVASWMAELRALKTNAQRQQVVLTETLRTASVSLHAANALRGAVRFEGQVRPRLDQWQEFRLGTRAWQDVPWVQGVYGSQTGLAQNWLRIELQMGVFEGGTADAPAHKAIPFFGSAAVYYELHR